jgi:tRNA isopentenyl-2-thiomethyl-A-37 hydroxylase MiaE
MNADRDLQNSYREWKRLAEAEGEAIRAGNWMLVFDCQNVLRQLQPRIIRQTEAAHREWKTLGLDAEVMENNLNAVIHNLIELERRNRSLIDARQRVAREELSKLEQASLTLRRIQRSYTSPNTARWASFS